MKLWVERPQFRSFASLTWHFETGCRLWDYRMLIISKGCAENSKYDQNIALDGLMNTFLGERLPRFKTAGLPPKDNASLPQHELIGRYVSCVIT